MKKQIEAILKAAKGYIGIKESPPGSNNVVFNTRYYGGTVSGSAFAWCATFIWCLFQDIGASELYYGGKKTASCTTLMNYAKQNGIFFTKDFLPGDLALFDFDGDKSKSEHIGIITKVNNGSVVTIEGNTSIGNDSDGGEVMERTRSNSLIIGVYRPKYREDENEAPENEESEENEMARYNSLAEVPEWGRATIEKLINDGLLEGSGMKDANGQPADLNLSEDMVRLLVINDRAGLY